MEILAARNKLGQAIVPPILRYWEQNRICRYSRRNSSDLSCPPLLEQNLLLRRKSQNRSRKNEEASESFNKSESIDRPKSKTMKKKKQNNNLPRLGAGGLSLHAFANAKSKDNHYNPALIKKQREFYTNAKKVNKFKKLLKQQNGQNDVSLTQRMIESGNGVEEDVGDKSKKRLKKDGRGGSLEELYKKKHEEKEKERLEREAAIKAKKEEMEKAESQRKGLRNKMFKKTRKGQPVMKYRIEHLLETIQGSTKI